MGWKNVRDHYRIRSQIRVYKGKICIGSSYISDIIVIDSDGLQIKFYGGKDSSDLMQYQRELSADREKLKELVLTPDTFTVSIPVYVYENGAIVQKYCEQPGWPNLTHDGQIMFENVFSTDKAKVIAWARQSAMLSIECARRSVEDARIALQAASNELKKFEEDFAKLTSEHSNENCTTELEHVC